MKNLSSPDSRFWVPKTVFSLRPVDKGKYVKLFVDPSSPMIGRLSDVKLAELLDTTDIASVTLDPQGVFDVPLVTPIHVLESR